MLSTGSLTKLSTCDERLQRLFQAVAGQYPCVVICGNRGEAEQRATFKSGLSKLDWPKSRHNSMPSTAVDAMPLVKGKIDWLDSKGILVFSELVKATAHGLGIEIEYGGDWAHFKDRDHYQLVLSKK